MGLFDYSTKLVLFDNKDISVNLIGRLSVYLQGFKLPVSHFGYVNKLTQLYLSWIQVRRSCDWSCDTVFIVFIL